MNGAHDQAQDQHPHEDRRSRRRPRHEEEHYHTGYAGHARPAHDSLYVRATLSQWRRSHAELAGDARPGSPGSNRPAPTRCDGALTQAALHAILARQRGAAGLGALLTRYDADPTADFALIASLLPLDPDGTAEDLYALSRVREAAFWLRWLELSRDGGCGDRPHAGGAGADHA
jgi:hypothetical protein